MLKNLGNLSPNKGSNKAKKRIGRGPGSGNGKTAGKGHKGQKARKSGNVRAGFEGGQMPLYRRLPKRGFTNPFRVTYNVVNVGALNLFAAGAVVNAETLAKAGLIRDASLPVKLLAKGKLEKAVKISVNKASAAAVEAVKKLGGSVEEI